jgi:hypothetical protein
MYWVALAVIVLGIPLGLGFRVLLFAVVLVAAAIIVITSSLVDGAGSPILNLVVAVVGLQAGYVIGFVSRVAMRAITQSREQRLYQDASETTDTEHLPRTDLC